jgi:Zn-dependent alcohol dehydrogenase
LGDAGITSQGYIIDTAQIPEPSTVVLSLLGGLGLLWNIRRRAV